MTKQPVVWLNAAFLIGTPLAVLVLVPWSIARFGLGWQEVAVAVALWWATGLGITAGDHRLYSHRSSKGSTPVRWMWALLGGAAMQNSVISWCAAHRYHHTFQTDYRNGPRWYHYDPSKWTLWGMYRLGHAENLRRTPDDVVLGRRFQHQRSELLDQLGERFEDWRERLLVQTHGVIATRDAMAQAMAERSEALQGGHAAARALEAEARMETALAELKSARQRWSAARSLRLELDPRAPGPARGRAAGAQAHLPGGAGERAALGGALPGVPGALHGGARLSLSPR